MNVARSKVLLMAINSGRSHGAEALRQSPLSPTAARKANAQSGRSKQDAQGLRKCEQAGVEHQRSQGVGRRWSVLQGGPTKGER